MSKTIIIDCSLTYTKIGVIDEHEPREIYLQDNFDVDLQNRVVQGQIIDIVKNLQAAFVDFGEEKKGLLHFKHIPECYKQPLNQGKRLPVQIIRENTGSKGHKLTAFINITGRHLVCLPFEEGINVSKKIREPKERTRLKEIIKRASEQQYGFIVRTSSQEATEDELIAEVNELMAQAQMLHQSKDHLEKGNILLEERSLAIRVIQDHIGQNECLKIICNDNTVLEEVKTMLSKYTPSIQHEYMIMPYLENLFKVYDVEKEFLDTLKKRVWLKNGGNLVIEPTEAMTVIDVNSAKAILKKNPAKAIMELNKLAVQDSIKQMIRRNLAGIIIIDLVDLKSKEDRACIYEYATQQIKALDSNRSIVYPITELGLLQIARTKKYTSLYQSIYKECNACASIGGEYKLSYLTYLIEQRIKHTLSQTTNKELFIRCNPSLYDYMTREKTAFLLQKHYGIQLQLIKESKGEVAFFDISYHFK